SPAPVYLGDDLSGVPEVALEDFPQLTAGGWKARKARTAAAALHLNAKQEDGFLKAVLKARTDLAGVPFAMGKACRTTGGSARASRGAAGAGRGAKAAALLDGAGRDADEARARVAVVEQVLPGEAPPARRPLVRALASVPSREATAALARL